MASLLTGNKFDPEKDIPDLSGKIYVVTGGTAGIGYGITHHLLSHHASKIHILSSSQSNYDSALQSLRTSTASTNHNIDETLQWHHCDLTSLSQTSSVAQTLLTSLPRLDGLVCNAGLGVGPYAESSEDGLDTHMQVNHFAQAHLALCLLPVLQRTRGSRLVFQASDMHKLAPNDVEFASVAEMNADIGPTRLYARTKLAQVLFVRELVRRMERGQFEPEAGGKQPWVNATHPGAVKTGQQEQAVEAYGTKGKIGVEAVRPFMKDAVSEGCRSALFAVAGEDVEGEGIMGKYIVPDRKVTEPSSQAKDEALAGRLWKLTKEVLESKIGNLGYTM